MGEFRYSVRPIHRCAVDEKYKSELIAWVARSVLVIALAIVSAVVQRYGAPIHVDPPPAPPVTVVVTPAAGFDGPPTVSVVAPKPE